MKEDFSNILILREDDGAESDLWEMAVLLATGSNSFEAFVAFNFAFERIWLANPPLANDYKFFKRSPIELTSCVVYAILKTPLRFPSCR
jgi:hypothetical protein